MLAFAGAVHSEKLPVRVYTTADGLANNSVQHIFRDLRGFLWFSTSDGVSRFDGNSFRSWTTDNGLPNRRVNSLMETKDGALWLATGAGLCTFGSSVSLQCYRPALNEEMLRGRQCPFREGRRDTLGGHGRGTMPVSTGPLPGLSGFPCSRSRWDPKAARFFSS